MGASHEIKGFVRSDIPFHGQTDQVLDHDIGRVFQRADRIQDAALDHFRTDDALDKVIDIGGDKNAVTHGANAVPRATDALQGAGDSFGRGHHHDRIHGTDIDAEFQAGGADDGAEFAVFEAILGFEPNVSVERGMMGLDEVSQFRQGLFQTDADAFRAGPSVREDEGGAIPGHDLGHVLDHP